MAGTPSPQYGGGPTPWWTLPDYAANPDRNSAGVNAQGQPAGTTNPVSVLNANAPSGYQYDPIKMAYVRTPTSAGQAINQFTTAALGGTSPSLAGLQSAAGVGTTPGTSVGTSGVAGGGSVGSGGPVTASGGVGDIAPVDMTAANASIYSQAKDVAGQNARASIQSLRGLLGETGQLGSGAEVQGTEDITKSAMGSLADVNRQEAETAAGNALDVAKTNQATQLAERGQNIAAQEANARIAMAQTQLNFQQQQAQATNSLNMLKLALGQADTAASLGSSFLY